MIDYFNSYSNEKVHRRNGFDYFSMYEDTLKDDFKRNKNKSFINSQGKLEHSYPYDSNDY